MNIVAVIPARYASSRFPGKPLAKIAGLPMIEHVYKRTKKVKALSDVIVATDDSRIFDIVEGFGGKAVMTPKNCKTGTDRIIKALKGVKYDWVLNVQGDEPLIEVKVLNRIIKKAEKCSEPAIITASGVVNSYDEYNDINVVKVVKDKFGRAIYFSRSPIPNMERSDFKDLKGVERHFGIYLYHKKALSKFVKLKESFLEKHEKLEQLRAMEAGIPIFIVSTTYTPVNVDLPCDIAKVEKLL